MMTLTGFRQGFTAVDEGRESQVLDSEYTAKSTKRVWKFQQNIEFLTQMLANWILWWKQFFQGVDSTLFLVAISGKTWNTG